MGCLARGGGEKTKKIGRGRQMGVEVVQVWESAKESGRMGGGRWWSVVVVNSRADLMGRAKTVVRQAKGAVPREEKREERRSGQSLGRSGG